MLVMMENTEKHHISTYLSCIVDFHMCRFSWVTPEYWKSINTWNFSGEKSSIIIHTCIIQHTSTPSPILMSFAIYFRFFYFVTYLSLYTVVLGDVVVLQDRTVTCAKPTVCMSF